MQFLGSDAVRESTSLNEAKLLLNVLKRIPLNRKITTSEIYEQLTAAGFKMHRRSLQRYLKALTEGDMGVECDKKSIPFGYRRTLSTNDLDRVGIGADGSLLLLLAREHLRYQMPPDLTNSMSYLFDAAERFMTENSKSAPEKQWLSKVCFVSGTLPQLPPLIRPKIFNTVSEALFKQKKLDVLYSTSEGEEFERRISPLGLVQQDVRLYLVCCYDDTTQIRNFALHRIRSAKLTNFAAEEPKGFDLRRYVDAGPFNYGRSEMVRLELIFTNKQTAVNLRETPFKRDQLIEELPDGTYKLTVDIEDSMPLKGWLAMWREKAGVISEKKTPLNKTSPSK